MGSSPMRSFDPRRVGSLECRAWETYYRRKWAAFLVASVGLVRAAFRMSWPRTLVGAWLVLRANMVWAPFPDNDPDAARALMRDFYRLLRKSEGSRLHTRHAAALEVEWWRAHREHRLRPETADYSSPPAATIARRVVSLAFSLCWRITHIASSTLPRSKASTIARWSSMISSTASDPSRSSDTISPATPSRW